MHERNTDKLFKNTIIKVTLTLVFTNISLTFAYRVLLKQDYIRAL